MTALDDAHASRPGDLDESASEHVDKTGTDLPVAQSATGRSVNDRFGRCPLELLVVAVALARGASATS